MKTISSSETLNRPSPVIDTSKMSPDKRAALELAEAARVEAGPSGSFGGSLFLGRPLFENVIPCPVQSVED